MKTLQDTWDVTTRIDAHTRSNFYPLSSSVQDQPNYFCIPANFFTAITQKNTTKKKILQTSNMCQFLLIVDYPDFEGFWSSWQKFSVW
jgi:hypothetical protein